MTTWWKRQLQRVVFFGLLLVGWQLFAQAGVVPDYLFPGPLAVFESLRHAVADGSLLIGIGVSLRRLAIGFALSMALGTVLGLLTARFGLLRDTLGLLILGLQALPSVCWMPLALIWFGLHESAIIFVVVMGSLLSVALAAEQAARNIPIIYLRVAANMGVTGGDLYRRVVLPAALPTFAAGLKQGWSFAWRSLLGGELLFVGIGLGRLLMAGRELNDMSRVIAIMLVIVLLGLAVDRFVFGVWERRIRRGWGPTGWA